MWTECITIKISMKINLFDESEIDGQAMFIFVDKFGNEFVTTRGEMA